MHKLFKSTVTEVTEPVEAVVTGTIPSWVRGSLYRNGPGLFDVGEEQFEHLFDGLAMPQRFHIDNGKVTYQARFVRSDDFKKNMDAKRIVTDGFGTLAPPDPCQNIFRRFLTWFKPIEIMDNTLVNIFPFNRGIYTTTETPFIHKVEPETLETLEKVELTEHVQTNSATAHPHFEADGSMLNIGYSFARGIDLQIFRFRENTDASRFPDGEIIASIRSPYWFCYNYIHSFAVTDDHVVIVQQPFTFSVPKILTARLFGRSVKDCMSFDKNAKTWFRVINKTTGKEVNAEIQYEADTFFTFHHVNAYEDCGNIIMDACCYEDASVIDELYTKDYTSKGLEEKLRDVKSPQGRRYVIPIDITQDIETRIMTKSMAKCAPNKTKVVHCSWKLFCQSDFEMPQINYERYNGKKYKYVYGLGLRYREPIVHSLIKVNTETGDETQWRHSNCYPSEPVFLPRPGASEEDDGVLLSAVNRSDYDDGHRPFLLVLDASSMKEIARAEFTSVERFIKDFHGFFHNTNNK